MSVYHGESFVPSEESMAESRRLLTMSDEIVEKGIERGSVILGITAEQARDLFIAMMHARAIPPLTHREAVSMATLEFERFLALVRR